MRPRIRQRHKVWSCCLPDYYVTGVIGYGYSPRAAYDEWRALAGEVR